MLGPILGPMRAFWCGVVRLKPPKTLHYTPPKTAIFIAW